MHNAKLGSTPFTAQFKLYTKMSPKTNEEKYLMSRVPYPSAIRRLMYAMICTRPNISYLVSVVSRYMANPVKWIVIYLRSSIDVVWSLVEE